MGAAMRETALRARPSPVVPWQAPRPEGGAEPVPVAGWAGGSSHGNLDPDAVSPRQARDRRHGRAGQFPGPGPAAFGGSGTPVAPGEVGMFTLELSLPENPGEPPETGDRRAAVRHPCGAHGPDHLVVRAEKESRWARLCDISLGGIGLLVAQPVTPSTRLTIQMRGGQEGLSPRLTAAVVHARPQADGTWRVGCAFDHVLSARELEAFL